VAARLTFEGLWTEADDAGYGLADARVLKGAIWPLDDDVAHTDVEDHLQQLAREHSIVLYEVGDSRYFAIPRFDVHQSAAYRRGRPEHPPPPPELLAQALGCNGVQLALSGVLEVEEKGKEEKGSAAAAAREAEFEVCWKGYPRKVEKPKAKRAYLVTRQKGATASDLLIATQHYAAKVAEDGTLERFIKHGATFFGPDAPWRDYLGQRARPTRRAAPGLPDMEGPGFR
jgi:hypothetical protein